MAKKPPIFRIVAKHKETGENSEIGVIWESPYGGNIAPVTEASDGKLPMAEVLASAEEYWLNVFPNRPRERTEEEDEDF